MKIKIVLAGLLTLFFVIAGFVYVKYGDNIFVISRYAKQNQDKGLGASVASSGIIQKMSCEVPGRKYNLIPVEHHVGSPELFTDFADCPTKTASRSGEWTDAGVWGGVLPSSNDVVLIPAGMSISLKGDAQAKSIGVLGSLTLDPSVDSKLSVSNFLTYPGSSLTISPAESAVQTISFTGSLDANIDPGQFGVGLVTIDSNVRIAGRNTRSTNSKIISAQVGQSTVQVVDDVSDWKVGQSVIFADSEKGSSDYIPRTEIKRITSVSGSSISLDSPLQFSYKSSVVYAGQNIRFTSETSVPGHLLFTGNTTLDFNGVYIEKMGRTRSAPVTAVTLSPDGEAHGGGSNQIGRYSLHAHHLEKPYNITKNVLFGNDAMLRWSVALHMSYGNFNDNSIVNPGEAAIGVETYLDSGTIRNNLIIGMGGGGEYSQQIQSFGIWSRSAYTDIINNRVEGSIKSWAYFIDPDESFVYAGKMFPNIPGSRLSGSSATQSLETGQFSGNSSTAYIGFPSGNLYRRAGALWLAHFFGSSYKVSDFKSTRGGIATYYSRDLYFDRVKLNETEKGSNSSTFGYIGVGAPLTIITNTEITGFMFGFVPGAAADMTNSVLDNEYDYVSVVGDQDWVGHIDLPGETVTLDSVKFSPTGKHIATMVAFTNIDEFRRKVGNLTETANDIYSYITSFDNQRNADNFARMLWPNNRIVVKNYNREGKDFAVYPLYTAPDFVIPLLNITNKDFSEGKSTHPFGVNVYGRSLGDHMVKNPIPNDKIIGFVEEIKPMKVVPDYYSLHPESPGSGVFDLRYNINSQKTSFNLDSFLMNFGGEQKIIPGVRQYLGLNKNQITVNGSKYTLLFVGPKGLPAAPEGGDVQILDPLFGQAPSTATNIPDSTTPPANTTPPADPQVVVTPTCTRENPLLISRNYPSPVLSGLTIPFELKIKNTDSPECGSSQFDMTLVPMEGWSFSNSKSVTLAPGEEGKVSASLTIDQNINPGAYKLSTDVARVGGSESVRVESDFGINPKPIELVIPDAPKINLTPSEPNLVGGSTVPGEAYVGELVISSDITNNGSENSLASSLMFQFSRDNINFLDLALVAVPEIPTGLTKKVSFAWRYDGPTTFYFRTVVDSRNNLAETNEDDNASKGAKFDIVVKPDTQNPVVDNTKPIVVDEKPPAVEDTTKPVVVEDPKPPVVVEDKKPEEDTTKPIVVFDDKIPTPQVNTPVIDSITPNSARFGDTVTLEGKNFEGVVNDLVFFTDPVTKGIGNPARVDVTPTRIVITVPNIPYATYNLSLIGDKGDSNVVKVSVLAPSVELPLKTGGNRRASVAAGSSDSSDTPTTSASPTPTPTSSSVKSRPSNPSRTSRSSSSSPSPTPSVSSRSSSPSASPTPTASPVSSYSSSSGSPSYSGGGGGGGRSFTPATVVPLTYTIKSNAPAPSVSPRAVFTPLVNYPFIQATTPVPSKNNPNPKITPKPIPQELINTKSREYNVTDYIKSYLPF